MPLLRLLCRAAVVITGAAAAPVAVAAEAPRSLGTTTAGASFSVLDDWAIWSEPAGPVPANGQPYSGPWRLMAWHDGAQAPAVEVATRADGPFDADLGTDAHGRVVATFSRCRVAPDPYLGRAPEGCRLRVLDLASGRERSAGVPRRIGDADATPSMWRGRVAFARTRKAAPDVAEVLLWSPASRRLTRLPHGTIPKRCARRSCRAVGAVLDLDLGPGLLAYRWWLAGANVGGQGGYEIRAVRLATRRSVLLGAGVVGDLCVGSSWTPGRPVIDGGAVWFSQTAVDCQDVDVQLRRATPSPRGVSAGALARNVLAVTHAAGTLYAITSAYLTPPPGVSSPDDLTCGPPNPPCTVQRIDAPTLQRVHARLRPPVV